MNVKNVGKKGINVIEDSFDLFTNIFITYPGEEKNNKHWTN